MFWPVKAVLQRLGLAFGHGFTPSSVTICHTPPCETSPCLRRWKQVRHVRLHVPLLRRLHVGVPGPPDEQVIRHPVVGEVREARRPSIVQTDPAKTVKRRPGCSRCVRRCQCIGAGPRPWRCLLEIAGLIDDQHRIVVLQLLDTEAAEVVADCISIPPGPGRQMLRAVRGRVPGLLGELPAVLARQVRQQSKNELPCPTQRFHPRGPRRDAAQQGLERVLPTGRIYAVTCGHRPIFCLHTLMVTGGGACSRTGPPTRS